MHVLLGTTPPHNQRQPVQLYIEATFWSNYGQTFCLIKMELTWSILLLQIIIVLYLRAVIVCVYVLFFKVQVTQTLTARAVWRALDPPLIFLWFEYFQHFDSLYTCLICVGSSFILLSINLIKIRCLKW